VTIKPLSNEEFRTLFKLIDRESYREQRSLLVNIVPFSGLTGSEFRHLRSDWINWGDTGEPIEIRIPPEDTCSPVKYGSGGNSIIEQPDPCTLCKDTAGPDHFTAENQYRERRIHIQETRAKKQLRQWFSRYDYIPVSQPTALLHKTVKKSSIDRNVRWIDLRNTYTRILAEQGFELADIARWLGYPNRGWTSLTMEVKEMLRDCDRDFTGQLRLKDYYAVLEEHGPMTDKEVAAHVDRTRIHTKRKLVDLEERGWATEAGERSNGPGRHPTLYDSVPEAHPIFSCDVCEEEFDSYRGKMKHIDHQHRTY
jgi:predicted transcriptional regulator